MSNVSSNPSNELQAIMRMHRIGQKNKVSIYRLLHAFVLPEDVDKSHIDFHMTKVKTLKENKFDTYINTDSNAARKWPVRTIEGTDEPSVIWTESVPDEDLHKRLAKLGLSNHQDIINPQKEGKINGGLVPKKQSSSTTTKLEKINTKRSAKPKGNKLSDEPKNSRVLTMEEVREQRLKMFSK